VELDHPEVQHPFCRTRPTGRWVATEGEQNTLNTYGRLLKVKIQQGGLWSAGICTPAADLTRDLGLDQSSWAVTSSGVVRTRGEQEYSVNHTLEEGDVLGFSYDHVELNIFCNGKNLDTPILGIKGTVFPVFYVDEGAILDTVFENFSHSPPAGFERIMIEKALL